MSFLFGSLIGMQPSHVRAASISILWRTSIDIAVSGRMCSRGSAWLCRKPTRPARARPPYCEACLDFPKNVALHRYRSFHTDSRKPNAFARRSERALEVSERRIIIDDSPLLRKAVSHGRKALVCCRERLRKARRDSGSAVASSSSARLCLYFAAASFSLPANFRDLA